MGLRSLRYMEYLDARNIAEVAPKIATNADERMS